MSIDDLLRDFLVESHENLDQLDRDFVALEERPDDRERLSSIFRTVHTLKGSAGFLGLRKLGSLTHAAENLIGRLREGELRLTREMTSTLLAVVDAVRQMLHALETSGGEGDADVAAQMEALNRFLEGARAEQEILPKPEVLPIEVKSEKQSEVKSEKQGVEKGKESEEGGGKEGRALGDDELESEWTEISSDLSLAPMGEILIREGYATQEEVDAALNQQAKGDPRRIGEILIDRGVIKPTIVREVLEKKKRTQPVASSVSESTIRVDVGHLDKLMNLAGELVLVRNQILQHAAVQEEDKGLLPMAQRLNHCTTELQEGVMKTRMQPIRNVWNTLPRAVRVLAMECGKEVRIETEGEETELDRTLIEAIKDPLIHIVRNAVDHGIERPEERLAAGKPSAGRLFLKAFHEGGQVKIEISDDGKGVDLDRVKQKAIERDLITFERALRMSEQEVMGLIFQPGFSTAEVVSKVSGRGVGMDVLKTNIERIGGSVEVQSTPGRGTIIKLKIPLTLAIIPVLIVTSGRYRYAIPQMSLLELVLLKGEQAGKGMELIQGAPVCRLRGRLLPLIFLKHVLSGGTLSQESTTARETARDKLASLNIVVLQAEEHRFGLVVDKIADTEEIVVKPLSKLLKGLSIFSGATVMGDGEIALILDVKGIAQHAGVISETQAGRLLGDEAKAEKPVQERQSWLLVRTPDDGRMGLPLSSVTRLERFSASSVERSGQEWVIQHCGGLLPLIHLDGILAERRKKSRRITTTSPLTRTENVYVVVCTSGECILGLVVDQILDIVEEVISIKHPASRAGVLFSTVIQDRVTEVLDVQAIIQTFLGRQKQVS